MSGLKSRNKGRGFEYSVARELYDQLGLTFVRELAQTRQAGLGDLVTNDCDFPFVIECKRYKSGVDPSWWDQVCTAASIAGKLPCLVYRLDYQKTRVRMPVQAIVHLAEYQPSEDIAEQHDWKFAVEMDMETACYVIREVMANG